MERAQTVRAFVGIVVVVVVVNDSGILWRCRGIQGPVVVSLAKRHTKYYRATFWIRLAWLGLAY
jgi:hypothetical protein